MVNVVSHPFTPSSPRIAGAAVALAAIVGFTSCGTNSTATPKTNSSTSVASRSRPSQTTVDPSSGLGVTTTVAGPDPNAPEIVAPGDIPDNQAFIAYQAAGGFSVKVPEGWARTDIASDHVSFSDKYNTVDVSWKPATTALTEAAATAAIEGAGFPGFTLSKVSTVTRSAGTATRVMYQRTSDPNAVTGKRVVLEVEQYEFWRGGTAATLTLSGAKGADNVDPWRIVTDGFAWAP